MSSHEEQLQVPMYFESEEQSCVMYRFTLYVRESSITKRGADHKCLSIIVTLCPSNALYIVQVQGTVRRT